MLMTAASNKIETLKVVEAVRAEVEAYPGEMIELDNWYNTRFSQFDDGNNEKRMNRYYEIKGQYKAIMNICERLAKC